MQKKNCCSRFIHSPRPLSGLTVITVLILSVITPLVPAESFKVVQWWDKYVSQGGPSYRSQRPNSLGYQDLNGDNTYNDSVVWFGFSITEPLNPLSAAGDTSLDHWQYRLDRPSARFYGGIVGRYTNVSAIKSNKEPLFDHFAQASVQKNEGARFCSYSTKYPNNTERSGPCMDDLAESCWGDMTLALTDNGGTPIGEMFQKNKNIEVSFNAVFLWKKADFINGGAKAPQITFDETSRLSVDLARWRKNIKAVRFVVQDGSQQLWMSEAVAVPNETGDAARVGLNNMTVKPFEKGVTLELLPLTSRWATYIDTSSLNETEAQTWLAEIDKMKFNPKKSSPEEAKLYYETSNRLLEEINQITFNPQTAVFESHVFTEVQAVGVYFATDEFTHTHTWLAFDNFQVYATGNVPTGKATVSNSPAESTTTSTTEFTNGISVNCGPIEQTVRQCLCDQVKVQGEITADSKHVGQTADILVYAYYKPVPESEEQQCYVLGEEGGIDECDEDPAKWTAFRNGITLQAHQQWSIYQGQFVLPGFLKVFFGYRLADGTLVSSADSVDIMINQVNPSSDNEMPYCESVKQQCSSTQ